MKTADIIAAFKDAVARHGLELIPRARMVNDADPMSFNYSLEEPLIRRYGSFLDVSSPWAFAALQPCIRVADFDRLRKGRGNGQHLSMFNMLVPFFATHPDRTEMERLHREAVCVLVGFLREAGLDASRLLVSYFGGGKLCDFSGGEVDLDIEFPPDEITPKAFADLGLGPEQLAAESNLDTFLVTFSQLVDFWAGYRFEVYVRDRTGGRFEVATGEAVAYRRVVSGGRVQDVVPAAGCVVPVVVGAERLATVLENAASVFESDTMKPLCDFVRSRARCDDPTAVRVLVDAVRATQMIFADDITWDSLNHRLREDLRTYFVEIETRMADLGLGQEDLAELTEMNAAVQLWLPELIEGAQPMRETLAEQRSRSRRSAARVPRI